VTISATIRRVWDWPNGSFTIIVQPKGTLTEIKLKTRDAWLASLASRYEVAGARPMLSVDYEPFTKELKGIALPVAQEAV
jgi:hypothetical protein